MDVTESAAFLAGQERGAEWARSVLAVEGADPKLVLAVEQVQAALGTDRGETAHGFLRGVKDVLSTLPQYSRPNLIIEVAGTKPAAGVVRPKRGLFGRIRSLTYGEDD